jgi:hypothetical protein
MSDNEKINLLPLRDVISRKNLRQDKDDDLPPIEFFATIHHDHYSPGEIEEINKTLLDRSLRARAEHLAKKPVYENTLTPAERNNLPSKDFAGPDDSFPIENKDHAHAAILDAIESCKAGHISADEKDRIIEKAMHFLSTHK